MSAGCRIPSLTTVTWPFLLTIPDDFDISVAISQSGKYSHVQVTTSQAQTHTVLSSNGAIARFASATSDKQRHTNGQNPPVLVSQIVPLNRR